MTEYEQSIAARGGVSINGKTITLYGKTGPIEGAPSLLEANLKCFQYGRTPAQGGLGKFQHYKNVVDLIWNCPGSRKNYDWQDYSIRISQAMCEHKVLAVAGCGGSGKTDSAAVFAIVTWLCDPARTMILATSTSLKDSRKRIWGSLTDYLRAAPGLPFKIIDSIGQIRTHDHTGKEKFSDKCGFALIAADKKNEKEAVGKLIGYHNHCIMLVADELPELGDGVTEAYFGNISTNPITSLIGLGNPSGYFDPFGVLSEPESGWDSVTMNETEWKTKRGYLIRLDAASSPNILAGRTIYPYLTTEEKYADAIRNLGENSAQFLRMYRAWFSAAGTEDVVFSGSDIIRSQAMTKVSWKERPVRLAGLDPSFTSGGDRTCLVFADYGISVEDTKVLQVHKIVFLKEDTTKKDSPRSYQIAKMVIDECSKEGVTSIQNFAMDITGAGSALSDVITKEWGRGMHKVQFGGSPSELPVSAFDNTPANKRYVNKVSEIWWSARELMMNGQLKGITNETAKEMVLRRFEVVKGETAKMKIESKTEMRERGATSPDVFDAIAIIVDMLRSKRNFAARSRAGSGRIGSSDSNGAQSAWKRILTRYSVTAKASRVLVR